MPKDKLVLRHVVLRLRGARLRLSEECVCINRNVESARRISAVALQEILTTLQGIEEHVDAADQPDPDAIPEKGSIAEGNRPMNQW